MAGSESLVCGWATCHELAAYYVNVNIMVRTRECLEEKQIHLRTQLGSIRTFQLLELNDVNRISAHQSHLP